MKEMERVPRKFNRRTFLGGLMTGMIVAAAGGLIRAWHQGVFTSGMGPAYEAWEQWKDSDEDIKMKLVRAAVLASNPHNSQPWIFKLSANKMELFADMSRTIGSIDPFHREMYMGLGCALENLRIAAEYFGVRAAITLLEENEAHQVAVIELSEGSRVQTELFDAMTRRHTNRGAYDKTREIPPDVLDAIAKLNKEPHLNLCWFTEANVVQAIGDLIIRSTEAIISDTDQSRDSHAWFRHDWDHLQKTKDGVTIDASGNSALIRGIAKMLPETSEQKSNTYWLDTTRRTQVPTAAVFGTIAVRDSKDPKQVLQAGQLWQRIHLWSSLRGVAMQPLNQIHERIDREVQLGKQPFGIKQAWEDLLRQQEWNGIFTFRMGYPLHIPLRSPRRPASEVIR